VGLNGNGTLDINSGGDVLARQVTIGVNNGSTGAARITDAGSLLDADDLTVRTGTLEIANGGRINCSRAIIGSGQVSVSGTGSFLLSSELDISGASAAGTLRIQTGGRVLVLSNTFIGNGDAIHLEGGALDIKRLFPQGFFWTSGALGVGTFDGSLTAPSSGVLLNKGFDALDLTSHIVGQLTLLAGSTAELRFTTDLPLQTFRVDASAVIDGANLRIFLNDFKPSAQQVFEIMTTGGGVFGSFANVSSGQRVATSDGLGTFLVHYGQGSPNPTSVVLSSFRLATPGDFDVDGDVDVDGRDFLLWQRGQSPTPGSITDLASWRVNFGLSASAAAGDTVPEPAAAAASLIVVTLTSSFLRTRATAEHSPFVPSRAGTLLTQ
jgi:T5SS/PEP-CTERM-associated repeat protein